MNGIEHRSGYIGIIGRPNVGKSTLMNRLLDYKLAITSSKPQTTRNRILGIKTTDDAQMIFVDTPGIHQSQKALNQYMIRQAINTLGDVDVILMLAEADGSGKKDDRRIIENIMDLRIPVILAVNKIDRVEKPSLLPLMETYAGWYPFETIAPISATQGGGVEDLEREILARLPFGPQYFPEDQITDVPLRFMAAEIVREKVFQFCGEEVPYSVAVVVEEFKERELPKPVYIRAAVVVEKNSQKGIMIGKGGRMLKRIGSAARADLQNLLDRSVYLELWVKVEKNWSRDNKSLSRLGYQISGE